MFLLQHYLSRLKLHDYGLFWLGFATCFCQLHTHESCPKVNYTLMHTSYAFAKVNRAQPPHTHTCKKKSVAPFTRKWHQVPSLKATAISSNNGTMCRTLYSHELLYACIKQELIFSYALRQHVSLLCDV